LFDGANAAQELSGNTVTANLLSGGIDEAFTRADSSGTFTQLKDALGSTVALVDAGGNLATKYSYDPFGNTTVSGATNSNTFQYTGRENEGNQLYFMRARYYSPLLGRFINEDPMGFLGGDVNLYGYVGNSPANFTDPLGLARDCFFRSCGGLPPGPWDKPKHLTDCAKNHLQPYFPGLDLGAVPFYSGKPFWVDPRMSAITLDDGVYYDSDAFSGSAIGLGSIGHELTHVGQWRNDPHFFWHYVGGWFSNLSKPGDAYRNIPAEQAAYDMENRIEFDLSGRYSMQDVCQSILQ
jgi:RHS repeat-associated protein